MLEVFCSLNGSRILCVVLNCLCMHRFCAVVHSSIKNITFFHVCRCDVQHDLKCPYHTSQLNQLAHIGMKINLCMCFFFGFFFQICGSSPCKTWKQKHSEADSKKQLDKVGNTRQFSLSERCIIAVTGESDQNSM